MRPSAHLPCALALLLAPLAGCTENTLKEIKLDAIAVSLGDFDDVKSVLLNQEIASASYDGFIVQATYEPEEGRTQRGQMVQTVEGLLGGVTSEGQPTINSFNAVFLASGTRGLNAVQYNNALIPDDSLLLDPVAIDHTCSFVARGGTLIVSDWSYDLLEACWPDAVAFLNEGEGIDGAQAGEAQAEVLATVKDEALREAVGAEIALRFDFSSWTVMEGVGADTEVLLSGDVSYQPSASELPVEATGVPLMVRFQEGNGQVVFTSFHWSAQPVGLASALLLGSVDGIEAGSGEESEEAALE